MSQPASSGTILSNVLPGLVSPLKSFSPGVALIGSQGQTMVLKTTFAPLAASALSTPLELSKELTKPKLTAMSATSRSLESSLELLGSAPVSKP